jgi:hypothetical protein
MVNEASGGFAQVVLSVLLFPLFFQNQMMGFVWGAPDPFWVMMGKRVFLLLPAGAVLFALWASIFCMLSVIVRQRRVEFLKAFMVTWWDLGKAIFAFWGGFFRFALVLLNSLYAFLRVVATGLWLLVQDILLVPFRVIKTVAINISAPGLPWIAVVLTLVWCLIEAVIFTYVMTPLVLDTLSNMTGGELTEAMVRIPLFLFLLFLILGSYAVLSNWADAVASRNVASIVKITAVEMVAVLVEVMFLYREMVDSLAPWFAQHASKDFDLGVTGTLAIAVLTWLGVRGMTWFLFAAHGVPVVTAVIQGRGLKPTEAGERAQLKDTFAYTVGFYLHIKTDLKFVQEKGDDLLGAILLPPLQIVSACVNFVTLLVAGHHLFDIPFKSVRDLMHSKEILAGGNGKKAKPSSKRGAKATDVPEAPGGAS